MRASGRISCSVSIPIANNLGASYNRISIEPSERESRRMRGIARCMTKQRKPSVRYADKPTPARAAMTAGAARPIFRGSCSSLSLGSCAAKYAFAALACAISLKPIPAARPANGGERFVNRAARAVFCRARISSTAGAYAYPTQRRSRVEGRGSRCNLPIRFRPLNMIWRG